MNTLVNVLLVLHILAMGIVFGGSLTAISGNRIPSGIVAGALSALILGIVMVMIRQFQGVSLDQLKIGLKLIVGLAICYFAHRAENRENPGAARPELIAAAGLTAANVAIAVLW